MALSFAAKITGAFLTGWLVLGSCTLDGSPGRDIRLLTGIPWKYEKAGFDSDQDGVFDALDPRIAGCEKENIVIFHPDGSGIVRKGKVKCSVSDPDSLPFMWSFQHNDSTLYFQDQYYRVKTLTSNKLEIYADESLGGVNSRYIIVFTHEGH